MKAVILCAGYGTRLEKDLIADNSNTYKHLIGVPKPLVTIGTKSLLHHWLDIFIITCEINEVVIVSNELHKSRYEIAVKEYKMKTLNRVMPLLLSVISDGSTSDETRTGAVSCMDFGAGKFDTDILFVAGDTLLDHTFKLTTMIEEFHKLKTTKGCCCLLISTSVMESEVSKHGIIETNDEGLVISFLEKPELTETTSRLQSPCIYIMSEECSLPLKTFLSQTKDEALSTRDATGNVIKFLITQVPVYAYPVERRYDIGNLRMYIECNNDFLAGAN